MTQVHGILWMLYLPVRDHYFKIDFKPRCTVCTSRASKFFTVHKKLVTSTVSLTLSKYQNSIHEVTAVVLEGHTPKSQSVKGRQPPLSMGQMGCLCLIHFYFTCNVFFNALIFSASLDETFSSQYSFTDHLDSAGTYDTVCVNVRVVIQMCVLLCWV